MTSAPAKPPHPALLVQGVTASYSATPVLWDVDAEFPVGQLSAIVGPNGAGKSTLLAAVLGLIPRDAGEVRILGARDQTALDNVAFVPQREGVDWDFPITVREVVEMGRYPAVGWIKRLRRRDHAVVDECLERVGMTALASRQIGQLSGGQRQRIFVARALAQQAPVMMLDEPFTGIDARTETQLLKLFRDLRDEGTSIIVVHHNLDAVREHFDHVLLLNVRAIASGPVAEVLTDEMLNEAYGSHGGPDERPTVDTELPARNTGTSFRPDREG